MIQRQVTTQFKNLISANRVVTRKSQAILGIDNALSTPNNHQLDMRTYTYPYQMEKYIAMKAYDCQAVERSEDSTNSVESMIYLFNTRHPLIQLRFNDHDCYHRRSCFKKDPECRTDLPQ